MAAFFSASYNVLVGARMKMGFVPHIYTIHKTRSLTRFGTKSTDIYIEIAKRQTNKQENKTCYQIANESEQCTRIRAFFLFLPHNLNRQIDAVRHYTVQRDWIIQSFFFTFLSCVFCWSG